MGKRGKDERPNVYIGFQWKKVDEIFRGHNIVRKDNSIIFEPVDDGASFVLYFYDGTSGLAVDLYNGGILKSFNGYFSPEFVEIRPLVVPSAKKGVIRMLTDAPLMHGLYYTQGNNSFVQRTSYDPSTGWYVVGNRLANGTAVEFAENNIAVFDEDDNIVAVYAKLFR